MKIWEWLQGEVAIDISQRMRLVQQLSPRLPGDVSASIAALGVSVPTRLCCTCRNSNRGFDCSWQPNEEEGPSSSSSSYLSSYKNENENEKDPAVSVCTSCIRPRYARFRPRIPRSSTPPSSSGSGLTAPPMMLGMLHVRARAPTWDPNRHFHVEHKDTRVVRHRMSGFHSFRTVVCDEMVVKGVVTYRIRYRRRTTTWPFSCGVGVVTPRADVNSEIAWCPGTRGWKDAWGLCIEGRANPSSVSSYLGMRATDETVVLGGAGKKTVTNGNALTDLLGGTGADFRITIDATNRCLEIEASSLNDNNNDNDSGGVRTNPNAFFRIDLEEEEKQKDQPLILTVSLKFAGDEAVLLPAHHS